MRSRITVPFSQVTPMKNLRIALAVTVGLLPAAAALAQTIDGKGRGLDALDEQVVMGRLASDGLNGLLDREFEVYKVPPAEREQQRAAIELAQLGNMLGLKPADRRAAAERVAKAIDPLVDRSTNVAELLRQAYTLTQAGIDPTVTELEYFGENPAAQAQLNPVVVTVRHMFQKAAALAQNQIGALQGLINNNNFPQIQPKLKAAGYDKRVSLYNFHRAGYALCISLSKDDPNRAKTADESITYLKQFDNPKSNIQADLRVLFGKLMLVKGDFAGAKATLDTVAAGAAGGVKPAPTPTEQNEGKYFGGVADLLAANFTAAAADLKAVQSWQLVSYLPSLAPPQQEQVKAADAMLDFRIASAQADAANDPAAKQQFNDRAVTILSDLLQADHDPTLRDLVFDQLVGRIPDKPDMAKLNPLALLALEQQGFDEYNREAGKPFDRPKLARAVDAARELARREGQPGVSRETAATAAYFAPSALDFKLDEKPAAAAGFMDFMEKYPTEVDDATRAMENAGVIVMKLHDAAVARNAPDPAEAALYDRFLPLAINPPYNHKQIASDYADLLRSKGKFLDAVKYYGMVPKTDKRYPTARYLTLVSLYAALTDANAPLPADRRTAIATQLQDVAAEVTTTEAAAAEGAKTDADKQSALYRWAVARYDAATSARRDLKDPAKSLKLLDGFEDQIKGLSNEKDFDRSVLTQRVNDYMDAGRTSDATAALLKLLAADPAAGAAQISQLIDQINHDLDAAKGNHDLATQRQLAANKAKLTGFSANYVAGSADPKVHAQLPAYRMYDADSKRQAAELADDPAARTADLTAALAQYQAVAAASPTVLDAAGVSPDQVHLGIGLTQYDLARFADAVASLAPVMKRVGQPFVNGAANPQFWETYYKQMRSVAEVAKQKPGDAEAQRNLTAVRQKLGGFFVLYGDKTGGPGYHDDFVKLATELKVPTGAPGKK
jgi:hypothetical protein